ncbi:hypothetical protein ACQJBY_019679 [Aegilops geniculata]
MMIAHAQPLLPLDDRSKDHFGVGKLLSLLGHVCHHLTKPARWFDHRHRAMRALSTMPTVKSIGMQVLGLLCDDDGVHHVVVGVAHGQHLEPASGDVLGVYDRVQEPACPVRTAYNEGRPVCHVCTEVRDHLGLVLGGHAHKRGQEDDVVRSELAGEVRDVGRVERHAGAQVLVRAEQLACALIGCAT